MTETAYMQELIPEVGEYLDGSIEVIDPRPDIPYLKKEICAPDYSLILFVTPNDPTPFQLSIEFKPHGKCLGVIYTIDSSKLLLDMLSKLSPDLVRSYDIAVFTGLLVDIANDSFSIH